jgi:hypothetical protein
MEDEGLDVGMIGESHVFLFSVKTEILDIEEGVKGVSTMSPNGGFRCGADRFPVGNAGRRRAEWAIVSREDAKEKKGKLAQTVEPLSSRLRVFA